MSPRFEVDVLAWLERNQFLALGLAGLLLLAGLAVRAGRDSRPPALVFREDLGATPGAGIRVHVAGAVVAPGVYELKSGDRVADAVSMAGGAGPGAELDQINLARRLRDGEQILVPGRAVSGAARPDGAAEGPIDINAADEDALMGLDGIGEAYARRIVDSRAIDGPFDTVDELVERDVLPKSVLEPIRDRLTASLP